MCGDLFNLRRDLEVIERYHFDFLHIDVMDGHFVPNITLGYELVNNIAHHVKIPKDIHLMVDDPYEAMTHLHLKHGDVVTFHVESAGDPRRTAARIRRHHGRVGLAISPQTTPTSIRPYLGIIDHLLIMTVTPGFAGQPLLETAHERIAEIMGYVGTGSKLIVGVDGAIGYDEIRDFHEMGVDYFVLGTKALFKRGSLTKQAVAVSGYVGVLQEIESKGHAS